MSEAIQAPTRLLIGGKWVDGKEGTFDVLDPSTGSAIASVARAGLPDMTAAIDAAAAAQPAWAAAAPRERSAILRKAFDLMIDQAADMAYLMSLEMGKSLEDSKAEVLYAAEFLRWYSEEAVRVGGELRMSPTGQNRIITFKKPSGVALLLTPWNFPAAMATRKLGPALAAGCSVVLKPAEDTPLTALVLARILTEAGVPDGVVNVVTTEQPGPIVEHALGDDRVRKLSFTGSTRVGAILLKQAADRIVDSSMELGGNNAFIVCADADLDAALDGAMVAKMRNGGQACTAANRFLVEEPVAEEFARRLAERMGALKMGPGTVEGTQLGPMINARQRDGIADKVSRSVAAGARAILGGSVPDGAGFYYPATVLLDVPRDCAVATEEIFGPVAPIIATSSDDDAIALANSSTMGLTGFVYTRDLARGLRICERLEVGMVGLNRGLVSDPAAPFGGVKHSGLGREGGFEGIEEYLETTYVAGTW
ncbi:NAD-dependent succinate-semialdehyde dehydrogenase [Actinospica robiniae]|uniref:NAD-dependent succinate-semialdehyde dehydrogenase n=1 Tax=Actinospica robiniae TaxID=304901 RepID=UPI000420225C|nr:NAD-dependent succinate-semialdehyde dehydrogenase [Actinospica robiniae]